MPVIVRELSDDAAVIFMVDSNLQRENILPSERTAAYKRSAKSFRKTVLLYTRFIPMNEKQQQENVQR